MTYLALALALVSPVRAQIAVSTAAAPAVQDLIRRDWDALKARQKDEREAFQRRADDGRKALEESLAGKTEDERRDARKRYRAGVDSERRTLRGRHREERRAFLAEAERRRAR